METLFTIGFTKKTAKEFFTLLKQSEVDVLVDTRINADSQLSGFAKKDDLEYFLKEILGIYYSYRPDLAPTKELLRDYRNKKVTWEQYERIYGELMDRRNSHVRFEETYQGFKRPCILCSEAMPERCHRRLLAEKIQRLTPVEVIHLC